MTIDSNSDPIEIAHVFTQLPHEIAQALSEYPGLAEAVVEGRQLPPLPPDFVPQTLVYRFDQMTALIWEHGTLTYDAEFRLDYQPEAFEIEVDGELAFVLFDRTICLNRLEQIQLPFETFSLPSELTYADR